MKTTMDIQDALMREAKSSAARRGESLKDLFHVALRKELAARKRPGGRQSGWRVAFGAVPGSAKEIDPIVEKEFGQVEPEDRA